MIETVTRPQPCRLFGLALLTVVLACTAVRAEQYRLGIGDQIRSQITGVSAEPYVTRVDIAGDVRLPYLGTYRAAGKTLDELMQDIALEVTGRQIRIMQNGGDRTLVLDERDVFLDIESYRPVSVSGVVQTPGSIAFEPGLTARAAIAAVGGFALNSESDTADRLSQLRGRFEELRKTQAWLMADLWRIDALLNDAPLDALPQDDAAAFDDSLTAEDIDVIKKRIAAARDRRESDRDSIGARIDLVNTRIAFLSAALEQYEIASDAAEARLADVTDLANRGLATATALASAQTGALNASSRVLTTEAELAGSRQEFQSLLGQEKDVDALFYQNLLSEKSEVSRSLAEVTARVDASREQIALIDLMGASDTGVTTRIVLYRTTNGVEDAREIEPRTLLRPGDELQLLIDTE